MKSKNEIGFLEKTCYGLGDLSGNLCYMMISSYLLYFYTDVAGIAVGAAGTFMAIVRIIDSLANPVIGMALDRTNTRFGKIRPFLLYTNLPLSILLIAVFSSPNFSNRGKIIYAAISFLLYSLIYSSNNTPYSALSTNMTDREDERLQLGKFRTIGMSIGSFAITLGMLPLVQLLGKGNEQTGYSKTAIFFALVSFVSMLLCFLFTKERIIPEKEKNSVLFITSIKYAFQSKPWVLLCIIQGLSMASFTLRSENTLYYCKYILENKSIASIILSVSSFTTIAIAFALPTLASKFGKKRVLMTGYAIEFLAMLGMLILGKNAAGVVVCQVIASLGTSAGTGLFFIMISETVDHSEWQCGIRQQGLLAALLMLIVKLFCMAASFIGSRILDFAGYAEGIEPNGKILFAIRTNFLYLPMIIALLFILFCHFYRLEEEYPLILKELHQRRAADKATVITAEKD